MNILISACLMGVKCRYDGGAGTLPELAELMEKHTLIPVCPEQLGGLKTPREPAEIEGCCVITRDGRDVTEQYRRGAEETLRLVRLYGCSCAIMKERSPSCGSGQIYDGTFSRTLTGGSGVTAALLEENGVKVFGESRVCELL